MSILNKLSARLWLALVLRTAVGQRLLAAGLLLMAGLRNRRV
jgi:hypothetical protein